MTRTTCTKVAPLRVVLIGVLLSVLCVSFFTIHIKECDPPPPSTQSPSTQSPSTQSPSTQSPSTQSPSTQSPSTQSPSTQSPSTQSPSTRVVLPKHPEWFFRNATDEVDCELLQSVLVRLYEESKVRRAAWRASGYTPRVLAPSGKRIEELNILFLGDSWARNSALNMLRGLDTCRMRMSAPLLDRDECSLTFGFHLRYQGADGVYQLSKAALGLAPGVAPEDAGILRINVHYHRRWYTVEAAQYLETLLRTRWPTPNIIDDSFPRDAQCREDSHDRIKGMEHQLPMCLCKDTLELEGNGLHRVPVDAIQVSTGMWDTQDPVDLYDDFAFANSKVDWFRQREALAPNLTVYPYMTWEDNVKGFRRFMVDNYVTLMRSLVNETTAPDGVPMPRILLSRIPRVNCSAPKFKRYRTLNSTERCMLMAWPLHDVLDDVVRAAYGEALLGLPAVPVPEWLRLVNYRPISATETVHYANYTGESIAPGEYLCQMTDGSHLDTGITLDSSAPPHVRWCAREGDRLFWSNLRRDG